MHNADINPPNDGIDSGGNYTTHVTSQQLKALKRAKKHAKAASRATPEDAELVRKYKETKRKYKEMKARFEKASQMKGS